MEKKYEDLRTAIEETVLLRQRDGHMIIASEFTGARSAWMFDFRALMLQPKWLNRYAEIFWEKYADKYPFQVCGMETAGISLVAAIVMKSVQRGTPVNGLYMRKSRKRYDLMKQIEGTMTNEPVILVDDLVHNGKTLNRQMEILAEIGKTVSDMFVLVAFRDLSAYKFIEKRNAQLCALFTLANFGLSLETDASSDLPRDDFEVIWRFQGPDPSFHLVLQKSAPVLDDKRVFFGADSGIFYALDKLTGNIIWTFDVGKLLNGKSILSTPVVHQGVVYFGAYDGNTYALDCETGKKKWVNTEADWVGSSPSLAPDLGLLYIGLEFGLWKRRGGIAAINMKTGATVWTAYHPSLTHGTPLYIKGEGLVVIGSNNHVLYAYDAKTGAMRWQYLTGGDIKVAPAYDRKRRIVFTSSMDGKLYALSAQYGTSIFARETEGSIYSIPLVKNDTVYFASLDKKIYAIDMDTWKDRWTYATNGRIFGASVIADDSLWCGSNDGRLYELDPSNGKLKSFFQATERVISRIAYDSANHHIFMRTAANELYCLKKVGRNQ